MESILTGLGLSGSAGLNTYLPLFVMGAMHRAGLMTLAEPYDTISHPAVMAVVFILLLIELTADKIPAVDSLNDTIHTVVRPAVGAFLGAASTSAVQDVDPVMMTIASLLAGSISAGSIHAIKATVRPGVTVGTAGMGNVLVSTFEDSLSLVVSVFAVLLPFMVLLFSTSVVAILGWWYWDYRRTRHHFPSPSRRALS
ncbi:MAG: DUF4126 domain-containing protein [Anaerolineales bacterium]